MMNYTTVPDKIKRGIWKFHILRIHSSYSGVRFQHFHAVGGHLNRVVGQIYSGIGLRVGSKQGCVATQTNTYFKNIIAFKFLKWDQVVERDTLPGHKWFYVAKKAPI